MIRRNDTIFVESQIDEERQEKGVELKEQLSGLSQNKRNAIIGYVHDSDVLKKDSVGSSLKNIDYINTSESLSNHGIAFISEEDLEELIDEFKEKIDFDLDDHQAWSIYTALEVANNLGIDEKKLEGRIYSSDSHPLHEKPVDLCDLESPFSLVTCKFKVQNQRKSAKNRLDELENIDVKSKVGLGTFSLQPKQRIKSYFKEKNLDFLVVGHDLLSFVE